MKANRYGNTPNKDIPLNDRKPGEIAGIAWDQLRRYQNAAETWPVHHTLRDNRFCNICRLCKQNIWFSGDEEYGAAFQYSEADIKALIVAHIRQRHTSDNGEIDEVSGECQILDGPDRANAVVFRGGPPGRHLDQSVNSGGITDAPTGNSERTGSNGLWTRTRSGIYCWKF